MARWPWFVTRCTQRWRNGSTALREILASTPPFRAPRLLGGWSLRLAKRLLDVSAALLCLILLCPLLLTVGVLIRLTTPGPALFRQTRLGKDRRTFVLYKFRTMYTGCSDDAHREYVTKLLTEEQPPDGGRSGVFKLDGDDR